MKVKKAPREWRGSCHEGRVPADGRAGRDAEEVAAEQRPGEGEEEPISPAFNTCLMGKCRRGSYFEG